MLAFFKKILIQDRLSIAFTRLHNIMGYLWYEYKIGHGDDDGRLGQKLIALAPWVEDNIVTFLTDANMSIDDIIYIGELGGSGSIHHFMNETIESMIRLSGLLGVRKEVCTAIWGELVYEREKEDIESSSR